MTSVETMIIKHEGLWLKPYHCTAGKLTIGVGRNLDDNGITKEEALLLLRHDIRRIRESLASMLPYWPSIPKDKQAILINMAFNMGVSTLMQFKKMLRYIRFELYVDASDEMMRSEWARQVPNRAKELSDLMRKDG